MRSFILAAATAGALLLAAAPAFAAPYSTGTTDIGTLLADPAARAVIDKYIPGFSTNPQTSMASGMTLQSIQPMSSGLVTDEVRAKIDADLAKLPAPKK